MKKVAYIITKQQTGELFEDSILTPIIRGQHGATVGSMYFVEDGVYHLAKGSRSSKNIKIAMTDQGVTIIGCEKSIKNRNLTNFLIDGIQAGEFNDFLRIALNSDHIICL